MDTTEDKEEQRRLAELEKAKKEKKGFSDKQLAEPIDINLMETETQTLLFIPGITGVHETDEYTVIAEENKKYDALLASKKGSDDYEFRGS